MSSQKQLKANRENALKGGVKTEEGKSVSRFNALKHGVLASLRTDLDDASPQDILSSLELDFKPKSFIKSSLLLCVANNYCRLLRAYKAESMYIKQLLSPNGGWVKKHDSEEEYKEYEIALKKYEDLKTKVDNEEDEKGFVDPEIFALKPKEPEYTYVYKKWGFGSPLGKNEIKYLKSVLGRYTTTIENRYYKAVRMLLETKAV